LEAGGLAEQCAASRPIVRAADPGQTRERRYFRDDIERLKERKEARRDPAKAASRGQAGVHHR
jgi:hypothetical protein